MIVCMCNALSDRHIRACAGACKVSEVYRACGCEAQCGKCASTIRNILRETSANHESEGTFVEGAAASPAGEG